MNHKELPVKQQAASAYKQLTVISRNIKMSETTFAE